MAQIESKITVHVVVASAPGSDGKAYEGSIAFGADSWAAMESDPNREKMAHEAAKTVAHRHAESMGAQVVGEIVIVSETDETMDVFIESQDEALQAESRLAELEAK